MEKHELEDNKRTVMAPSPIASPQSGNRPQNSIMSVALEEDEDVEWTWTSSQDGRYVSGYTIIKRTEKVEAN